MLMNITFRALNASEVEARVATVSSKGVGILIYKDARVDMQLLDEVVGPMGWKREHTRDNANCIVSIWDPDKSQWISKEDTGVESNAEAKKGLASDSFKRACFCWGIGRELYTSPFIWFPAETCNIKDNGTGKPTCYDKFIVNDIVYLKGEQKIIESVTVTNKNTGVRMYFNRSGAMKVEKNTPTRQTTTPKETSSATSNNLATDKQKELIVSLCKKRKINIEEWFKKLNLSKESLTKEIASSLIEKLNAPEFSAA